MLLLDWNLVITRKLDKKEGGVRNGEALHPMKRAGIKDLEV